jgi:ribonuclease P protein component
MTQYFTLFTRAASTKKQGLRLAFGARTGRSTARNRAKRQARETYRLYRSRLPEAKEVVITSRGNIDGLSRRAVRQQLVELFGRAIQAPAQSPGTRHTTMRTSST